MKTKEFIKKVEELGYRLRANNIDIIISDEIGVIATVNQKKQYGLSIYAETKNQGIKKLFHLCVKYASTPIDERGEEQKFYLQKIKSFYEYGYNEKFAYLLFITDRDEFGFGSTKQGSNAINRFTQREIDKIKEEQHTDLSEFKQIPVEEIEE